MKRGCGDVVVRLLTHLGESGSIPGFSHVGIVSDFPAGRRVFSGISYFTLPCIPVLLHTYLTLPSLTLKNSICDGTTLTNPAGWQTWCGKENLEFDQLSPSLVLVPTWRAIIPRREQNFEPSSAGMFVIGRVSLTRRSSLGAQATPERLPREFVEINHGQGTLHIVSNYPTPLPTLPSSNTLVHACGPQQRPHCTHHPSAPTWTRPAWISPVPYGGPETSRNCRLYGELQRVRQQHAAVPFANQRLVTYSSLGSTVDREPFAAMQSPIRQHRPFLEPRAANQRMGKVTSKEFQRRFMEWSGDIWVALNPFRPSVHNCGGGERGIPEKTRRSAASSCSVLTCENLGATQPGIEPGSPRWEACSLTHGRRRQVWTLAYLTIIANHANTPFVTEQSVGQRPAVDSTSSGALVPSRAGHAPGRDGTGRFFIASCRRLSKCVPGLSPMRLRGRGVMQGRMHRGREREREREGDLAALATIKAMITYLSVPISRTMTKKEEGKTGIGTTHEPRIWSDMQETRLDVIRQVTAESRTHTTSAHPIGWYSTCTFADSLCEALQVSHFMIGYCVLQNIFYWMGCGLPSKLQDADWRTAFRNVVDQ
ncbi:hypothetical protein PR048_015448 [Dryococelus australis]|uniref:Uncharacterized protein n=1 Tax=Dryococelus australis TaxID=614101 RepID=A0ABQ9HH05_9NEOP|nr:hypothetical protein PR048_015448 [Dryococelus australis]